jgi:cytochrome c2
MRKLLLTGLVIAAAVSGVASAADRHGNAQAGRDFAGHNCDACHVIATNQDLRPLVTDYAPSFYQIANEPNVTKESLRAFLSRPHGYSNMPYPDLTSTDLANVVAYITSLRGHH